MLTTVRLSGKKAIRVIRAGLGMVRGMLAYPIAWCGLVRPGDPLAKDVAELLLMGFYGSGPTSFSARLLARQVRRGQVGSVFFVGHNVGKPRALTALLALFAATRIPPLLAIDHEGGWVQRLKSRHGASTLPAAQDVCKALSPAEAQITYARAGVELRRIGFNLTLGPVLDVHDQRNPAIGQFGRAYDSDPERIADYGAAFISGSLQAGVACAAKHFPGHGRAFSDSHFEPANASCTWSEAELLPFVRLLASPTPPPLVMVGHLRVDPLDPAGLPATISAPIIRGLLREKLGYRGIVMTDDIDMGAISTILPRKEAFIAALAAGNDLVMIKNLFGYDPLVPERAVAWVREGIARGQLSEESIKASAGRVRALRAALADASRDPGTLPDPARPPS